MKKIIIVLACLLVAATVHAKKEDKAKKQKNLPYGLEKKLERTGELPPGWQKKLVKGNVLDPSLYKRSKPFVSKSNNSSVKPKQGTEVLQIEDRIIRIKKDTKEILDIMGIKATL